MRILVISDIHANYEALEAVLTDAGAVDAAWCLGDIVGYGPDPNLCVDTVRALPNLTCLLGNHDVAMLGRMPLSAFNGEARRSLDMQSRVMSADNVDFLRSLPENAQTRGEATLAHGSPRDPIWEYMLNTLAARLNFDHFETPFCFVGHTHLQGLFQFNEEKNRVTMETPRAGVALHMKPRAIFNPGSVGQPRDRDPRAAYAIFDPEARTWEPRRVGYDIPAVQKRIRALGLPEKHALRIGEGW
ncbi:MAG: metallophosphoesterase [Anaerolineaceae bacterium]|nr:MAG: metallophosphoesterase family protein [Anaerolineales bacterium]GJQ39916.1 MAG: metallophosphoesterase [Anaerolineaceae bacterium]